MNIIKLSVVSIIIYFTSVEVMSQGLYSSSNQILKNLSLSYLFGVETSFISPKRSGLTRMFYGTGDAEENFFRTHSLSLGYTISDKFNVGLALKYGDNFYRSSSKSRRELGNGDRDYNSYLALGFSGQVMLHSIPIKGTNNRFRIENLSSVQYLKYKGVYVSERSGSKTFLNTWVQGFFAESGIVIGYDVLNSKKSSTVYLFYQPLSFQVGTYGLAFQFNGFGLTVKF